MIAARFAPFLLLPFAPLGWTQDEAATPPAALRAMTFEDLYGDEKLDLAGSVPRGLTWLDDERYLEPVKDGSPQVVTTATGETRPAYDAEALTEQLIAAGLTETLAEAFPRRPAQLALSLDEAKRRALLISGGDLYAIDFGGPAFGVDSQAQTAVVRLTETPGREELPALSPDGRTAAYVRNHNLYATPLIGRGGAINPGPEVVLTVGGNDLIRYGKADWVYYEELYGRSWKGYRWSPDSRRLAVMEYDDRAVGEFVVLDQASAGVKTGEDRTGQRLDATRYPKTGSTNPTVRLGVVDATGGPIRWIDWTSDGLPGLDSMGRTPGDGGGLIAHYGWSPDGASIYAYLQDRVQSFLSVRSVALDDDGSLGSQLELLKEKDGAWVESPGDLNYLPDGSFLIASTRDGWRHLYRYSADGEFLNPVTSGLWEVRELNAVAADSESGQDVWIYFSATRDEPHGLTLYRVRPNGSGLRRLTPESGMHNVTISPGGKAYLDTHSAYDRPPKTIVRTVDAQSGRTIGEAKPSGLEQTARGVLREVEIPVTASQRALGGTDPAGTISGYLLFPPDLDRLQPERRVPVWVMTYGGPHSPTVRNDWAGGRGWEHLLATNGIAVLRVDPRAASGRGWAAAWEAHGRVGEQETHDMKSAAAWLRAQPWCDGDRIGLSGHSYGGYLTARVLTHTKEYAAGIAGGSVTDFRNYDTIYTERLMDTPAANPEGYELTNLSPKANDLHGRLLLIHGGMDDNVHPQNVWQFVDALQKSDKTFELMIYPRDRHGIRSRHYRRTMWEFIQNTMLGDAD
ncbi:MAG: DPP IV N-terminal domain-containing protein [Planctomycetota bacterium]